jgi:hypothetical protein
MCLMTFSDNSGLLGNHIIELISDYDSRAGGIKLKLVIKHMDTQSVLSIVAFTDSLDLANVPYVPVPLNAVLRDFDKCMNQALAKAGQLTVYCVKDELMFVLQYAEAQLESFIPKKSLFR